MYATIEQVEDVGSWWKYTKYRVTLMEYELSITIVMKLSENCRNIVRDALTLAYLMRD